MVSSTIAASFVSYYTFILYPKTSALTPAPLPLFSSVGRSRCRNSPNDENGEGNSNMSDVKRILVTGEIKFSIRGMHGIENTQFQP
jgi:hypothetical protein